MAKKKPKQNAMEGVVVVSKSGVALLPDVLEKPSGDAFADMAKGVLRRQFKRGRFPIADQGEPQSDGVERATIERQAQYGDEPDKFKTDKGRIIRRLSPVDTLYSHDEITGDAYNAYLTYVKDWYMAGFAMKGGIDFSADRVDGGGNNDPFKASRIDAANRFSKASIAIGQTYTKALSCMVLDDMSMTAFARDILAKKGKSAAEHGRKMLIRAINCLANHYGPSTAPAKPRARSSMAEGARPQIHPFQKDEAA